MIMFLVSCLITLLQAPGLKEVLIKFKIALYLILIYTIFGLISVQVYGLGQGSYFFDIRLLQHNY